MKKEIAKRVLGRKLARQLDVNGIVRMGGAGTSWYGTLGGFDVTPGDCTDNQGDTFYP
ncbi:MAG TPA: hypothetical protein VGS22_27630 [Thermoanaerobaculia bacterium]|jgi:hypothetical protein|nr:hypothetical protein [Thermoanaerobaculia bacterium]